MHFMNRDVIFSENKIISVYNELYYITLTTHGTLVLLRYYSVNVIITGVRVSIKNSPAVTVSLTANS